MRVKRDYKKTPFVTRLCVLYTVNVPSLKVIVVTLMHVTVGGRWELKGGSAVHCVKMSMFVPVQQFFTTIIKNVQVPVRV